MPNFAQLNPYAIPYPGVNSTGIIDISKNMAGIAGAYGRADTSGYSGAYLSLKNDSDSWLFFTWDNSASQYALAPGEPGVIPIRYNDTKLKWLVQSQNAVQSHPLEQLIAIFLEPTDVAAGYPTGNAGPINPSTPAGSILPGALPEGVTIGADDVGVDAPDETFGIHAFINTANINSGALPAGVTIPAGQVTAGTLIAGVHETSLNSDGGAITSDGVGNLTVTPSVNTSRVNFTGTLSASNKIQDLQQGYQYFSDNTGALGTTRNWLDGPDRGEFQIGPRTGANFFDWIRLRATRVTLDLGKNTSPNAIGFFVTGGSTSLDTGTITTDGAGAISCVALTASGKVKGATVETPIVQATGGITAIGGTGATRSLDVDGSTANQLTIAASDDGGGHASGLAVILRALTSAGVLQTVLSGQANGVLQIGTDDNGTKRIIQVFIGSNDPNGRTGITVNEGDVWLPV